MATLVALRPAAGVPRSRDEIYRARYLIAFAVALASVLELVDTSIVNVAIPHMMGNLGATLDEIAWVSTGYIVANVIVLPLTSWLSDRFGPAQLLHRLDHPLHGRVVLLRQRRVARDAGRSGAWCRASAAARSSRTAQAILFDVFPLEERGTAMAIFGMGVMVGPTLGPDARRLDHRQLLLALDLLHQHPARAPRRRADLALRPGARAHGARGRARWTGGACSS